jgi:FlaG/FlaF family flagellin (archaellin)
MRAYSANAVELVGTVLLFAIAIVLAVTVAHGQNLSTDQKSFFDNHGSFAGSSVRNGNTTSAYDARGHFDGSAIRNSDGTTSLYDRNGHFTGSVTQTGPRGR